MAETLAIEQALAAHNLGALQDLAFQPGGFGQDDGLRLRCWGFLVGVVDFGSLPPLDVARAAETSSHGDRGTVSKDVNRSLWAAGERRGWSEKVRNKRRRALARVVNATFDESQHYYQGFHDVAAVVLDVSGFHPAGERRALAICRALVRRRLSDACKKDFADVSTALKLLPPLIHALDGELGQILFRPHDPEFALLLEPLWALSWAVTLFAHNVDDRASLVVLWDRLLAAPPCFPLYLGAALVVHHRESLIATATEDDAAPFLHGALSKLPGLTSGPAWDSIATSARRLLATTPPARAVARALRRLRPYLAPVRDVVRTPYFFGRAAPDGPTLLSAAPASAPAAAPSRRRNGRRRRRRDDQPLVVVVPARRQRVVVARRFSVAVALAAILGGLVTENALLRAFLEDPATWTRALVQNLLA